MGFLSGRVSYLRFRHAGPRPDLFGDDQLEALRRHQAGAQRLAAADGVETGWTAGGSVLDTDFQLEKNVVNDALAFEFRADTDHLPGDLLRAYTAAELKALAKDNPGGRPSARQKREAKEIARERLEQEAKDGRFKRRKCSPVLWDRPTNTVLFGATSFAQADRFRPLWHQTFGGDLMPVTAGVQSQLGAPHAHARFLGEQAGMVALPAPSFAAEYGWIATEDNRDWLGNEFLLWLWYWLDVEGDTLTLPDGSEATVMIARALVLDCPRGQTGTDTFRSEGPTRLPEARRALQAGKLPRRAGLTVVRHDRQYELTLHAETLAVQSAKLPKPDLDGPEADAAGKAAGRVDAVRGLVETLDGLYSAFLARRLGAGWAGDLGQMRRWLDCKERSDAA
jgi:hypothetical protein